MTSLVTASDLTGLPGAPFTDALAEAAGESVRDEARWHIAPKITETLTVWSEGGPVLLVPSLRIVNIIEIRDVSGDTPVALTGWVDRGNGILHRAAGWPINRRIEVELEHGYDACPKALLPVIAHRAQAARLPLGSVRLGSLSTGFSNPSDSRVEQDAAIISRYSL